MFKSRLSTSSSPLCPFTCPKLIECATLTPQPLRGDAMICWTCLHLYASQENKQACCILLQICHVFMAQNSFSQYLEHGPENSRANQTDGGRGFPPGTTDGHAHNRVMFTLIFGSYETCYANVYCFYFCYFVNRLATSSFFPLQRRLNLVDLFIYWWAVQKKSPLSSSIWPSHLRHPGLSHNTPSARLLPRHP